MKTSLIALTLSLFASVFAMEVKDVRKSSEQKSDSSVEGVGAMVPFEGEHSIVPYNPEAEVDAWLEEAVEVNAQGLQEDMSVYYAGALTMFSPEAVAQVSGAINGTRSFLYYSGTQLYCMSQVALIFAQRALAAAEVALDKAEEVEGGVKQVLDRAENVADRYHTIRGEFNKDIDRANTMIEGKKASEDKDKA